MMTNHQVRKLMKLLTKGKSLEIAAAQSGMAVNTAKKYRDLGKLPNECKKDHNWATRKDPFEDVCSEVEMFLEENKNIEAKTIFEFLQRKYPGKYQKGQLRTLQRKVKKWKITKGPKKEVFFTQKHEPGFLGQSDFTRMGKVGITIQHQRFEHILYHILIYSNWEFVKICFSEKSK